MQYVCGCNADNHRKEVDLKRRYRIQLGIFKEYNNAFEFQRKLLKQGYKTDIALRGKLYSVQTYELASLDEAAAYEFYLRKNGFNTLLIS